MKLHRPFGISILAALMLLIGGFSIFTIFFHVIDSIRFYGWSSLTVCSAYSFIGFAIYGCIPILFYNVGVGLFESRIWAWNASVFVIPLAMFIFFFSVAMNAALTETLYPNPTLMELLYDHGGIFLDVFFRYFLFITPLVFYLTRPAVIEYFKKAYFHTA